MHRHPIQSLFFLLALCFSLSVRAESLEARINPLLDNPQLKGASVSLDIQQVTANGPVPLYSHDPNLPLGPASNCKLLTTAAAFERYGPHATFKTNLFQVGPDLLIVGGGDPGLGDTKIAARHNESPIAAFEQWAQRLAQAGITSYRDLIVDDRIFDSDWTHANWPAGDRLSSDSAPIGGLNFNANCLDWTPLLTSRGVSVQLMPDTSYVSVANKASRGKETKISMIRPATSNHFEFRGTLAASAATPNSVPIYDPGLWTGTILRDILTRAGISQSGQIRRAAASEVFPNGTLLAGHETPILDVIQRANTNSLNMMAECLCKRLGYDSTQGRHPGSWANGTAAVESFVTSLGIRPELVSLDDGSGLSSKNRVAARAFTTVLAHVAVRPDGDQFIATLALPGEDGTLERRFKGMSVADHIHAKTGHINGVSTLSGYLLLDPSADNARPGRRFVFSILVNKYQGNVNPWQDQVCQALYDWARQN